MEHDQRISLREKIFREVVVNFLVHREYTSGVPGRCILYKDRAEFANPCIPHHIGLMTLKNLVPRQKNPLISKFFIQLGWVEEIGSGFVTVNKYIGRYAEGGRAEFYEDDIFRTIVYFSNVPSGQVAGQVMANINRVIGVLHGQMTRKQLQEALNLRGRANFEDRYLKPAVEKGYLAPTLPDKPNSRLQKYRLTDKGRKYSEGLGWE